MCQAIQNIVYSYIKSDISVVVFQDQVIYSILIYEV